MEQRASRVGRRAFLVTVTGAATALLAACAGQAPAPAKPDAAKPDAPKPSAPEAAKPAAAATTQAAPAAQAPAPTAAPKVIVPTLAPTTTAAAAPTPTMAAKPAAQVKRGGVLRVNSQNDWSTMDLQTSQTGNPDAPLVYDFLTKIERNPANGAFEVKPHLAESWDVADGTTVTLKLRWGVKFHDGSDFDANVVKWNLERAITHPKSTAKLQVAAIDAIDVVDSHTVRLKLKAPSPSLFVNLTSDAKYVSMMSKVHHDKVGDEGVTREAVGTGPFKFAEWKPSSHVRYERFDGYWQQGADGKPLPYPDAIELRFQPDPNVALVQMRSGELDLSPTVLGRDIATIKSNPQLVYREAPWQSTVYCLGFNARPDGKFAGDQMKKVRQAAMYALDRDAMAKALGFGIGEPAGYLLAPGQLGYDETLPKYTFDLAKAKALMAEAGMADGVDVTLDFISRPEDQQNAQLYQQMLAQVGIRLTLAPSERVAWVQKTMNGGYEMLAFQTGTPRPDTDLTLTAYLGTKGTSAWVGINSAEVDKLLEEGRTTYDEQKRVAAYAQVQRMVHEDAYVGYTWRRSGGWAVSKTVQDFEDPYLSLVTSPTRLWLDR